MTRVKKGAETAVVEPAKSDLCFVVKGSSMWFLLRENDVIRVKKELPEHFIAGDVVVLFNPKGSHKYVVHRLLWKHRGPEGWRLWTAGDWSWKLDPDEWLPLGRLVEIRRGGASYGWDTSRARAVGWLLWLHARAMRCVGFAGRLWMRSFWSAAMSWSSRGRSAPRMSARLLVVWAAPAQDLVRDAFEGFGRKVAEAVMAVFVGRVPLPSQK